MNSFFCLSTIVANHISLLPNIFSSTLIVSRFLNKLPVTPFLFFSFLSILSSLLHFFTPNLASLTHLSLPSISFLHFPYHLATRATASQALTMPFLAESNSFVDRERERERDGERERIRDRGRESRNDHR